MAELLGSMTRAEKVGQLVQLDGSHGYPPDYLGERLRAGGLGSVINNAKLDVVNELQRIAVEESRLGIPLLIGRDVIHGFRHVLPIPLGQAATWNPELVLAGARVAAEEAARAGINWTFAPMMDITRDPRWGRVAECLGEDPHLASELAAAMVRGFQTDDPSAPTAVAACAKHYAGYGGVDAGRDYDTTNVPRNELRNVHLRPFRAAVEAGALSLMTSFSEIDGIPCTANRFLLRQVLRDEWGFDGLVVSDWDSVRQLSIHGLTADDREAAREAFEAGVDIEMQGEAYAQHLQGLVESGDIDEAQLDAAVSNVLRVKFQLGLFKQPYVDGDALPAPDSVRMRATAREAARQSLVLLKNHDNVLPLDRSRLKKVALLGPLADAPYQQLGTWIFDGDASLSVTLRLALGEQLGDDVELSYLRVFEHSRSRDTSDLAAACELAAEADVVVLGLGEESILSGEAHCRADIELPGAQRELVHAVRAAGKPVVGVILAGRPLTLSSVINDFDALLYAWHPGIEAGPAIADILLGDVSPSGKLPITFPSVVGQVPIYYNHKMSGKPPLPGQVAHIDSLHTRAPQTSLGMSAYHLDAGHRPLFPFGFGLSYGQFHYHDLHLDRHELSVGDTLTVSVRVTNHGALGGDEVAQLYVRDLVGNVTRPVRELKGFKRVSIAAGETATVRFQLHTDDLGFYDRNDQWRVEPGAFQLWVGGDSNADLESGFYLHPAA
ncbi:MAG: glycoside hydrolase family 3 N-terminal domain-containing protein [Pseudomonadota bacterium]